MRVFLSLWVLQDSSQSFTMDDMISSGGLWPSL